MNIEQRLMKPFTKAKYLSEPNFRRYTTIVNYLYLQHELYYAPPSQPLEIFEHMKSNDRLGIFTDYQEKNLEEDLKQLEEWGNVISHADSSHVNRIEDFNKRKLRYQCTQETIDIERLLEEMNSKLHKMKGALDSTMVSSLSDLILTFQKYDTSRTLDKKKRAELNQLWNHIFEQFDKLRQEASDYLGIIHSKKLEEAMQNKEISAFRVKFTEYLTDFIISLQENVALIEYTIKEIDKTDVVRWTIKQIIQLQKDKPTLGEELTDEEVQEVYVNQWNGIKKWFVYDEFGERFVNYLMKQTNETISKFTSFLQQLSEREQQIKSRKHELLHLAKLFEQEGSFEMCQQSFGALTNIEKPPHMYSARQSEVYPDQTIIEQRPENIPLKDIKQVGERRRKVLAASEVSAEDEQALIEYNRQKKREEQILQEFTSRGQVPLGDLDVVEPFIRHAVLGWISRSTGKRSMSGRTEQGVKYRIEKKSSDWIALHSPDGSLRMPDYILYFEVS